MKVNLTVVDIKNQRGFNIFLGKSEKESSPEAFFEEPGQKSFFLLEEKV